MTNGRFRRAESGRPYIKCNDCGARFIEAQCDKTLEEWLEMKDTSLEKLLVSNQVLGPELAFSPPVLIQSISRIRDGPGPKVVTICKKSEEKKEGLIGNTQVIGVVKVDDSIREANPSELARLIKNEIIDERLKIDEAIEKDHGVSDVIVYGANLTFVSLEGVDLYGFDWKGHRPKNVSYFIDGVGDAGTVLVLPDRPNDSEGRIVTMTLPEDEIMKLKNELNNEWCIA
ncbi:hypothetical protein KY285_037201 [Solanum tuberosum]|nr:hypothetical protein KY285_037201 [Solanum tuberosum]